MIESTSKFNHVFQFVFMLLMSPVCTLKAQTDVATRLKNSLTRTIKADITLGALPDDDDYVDDDDDDDGDDDDDYNGVSAGLGHMCPNP